MNPLIQWPSHKYWTKAYNPVVGCKKISEGCQNCYAKGVVERFGINNGDFTPTVNPNAKAPKSGVVFVGNMTDIFGEWNSHEQINNWMYSLAPSAVNLILTKRAENMADFLSFSETMYDDRPVVRDMSHLWFGVTAENQEHLEDRLPVLFGVQKRWLSLEPLLGAIDFCEAMAVVNDTAYGDDFMDVIGWVVVGAESGANRRPCKLEWVESIVQQCKDANVPVFVKQIEMNGKLVKDINQFPEHLQIRQVPWAKEASK